MVPSLFGSMMSTLSLTCSAMLAPSLRLQSLQRGLIGACRTHSGCGVQRTACKVLNAACGVAGAALWKGNAAARMSGWATVQRLQSSSLCPR